MKNRKIIIIIIAALVIVAAIVVGSILLLQGKPNDEDQLKGTDPKVTDDSTNPISNQPIKVQAQNSLQTILDASVEEDEEPDELLTQAESRSGFEVLSCEETETGAVATIRVYAPNLYAIAKELDENNTFDSEEELRQAVIEAVGKAEIVEQEIPLQYVMTENGLEPVLSMEFIDAYYGGIFKLLAETLNKKNDEVAE